MLEDKKLETRVEKFKKYREEIQNSFSESDYTTKMLTSSRVEKIIDEQNVSQNSNFDSKTISYDELMNTFQTYETYDENDKYVSPLMKKHKKQIAYNVIATSICLLLALAIIVICILHFGGNIL